MRLLLLAGVGGLALGLGPWAVVQITTADLRHHGADGVPAAQVALVLGAGLDADGRPTPFLQERIVVAAELYRRGTVRALLMSGDHSTTSHDEVNAMAAAARQLGVPDSAIVLDHAGFDTYSSCYRAKSVWGLSSVVVVSQPFHLPRAVWLCRSLGLAATGAGTPSDDVPQTDWGQVREIPASDKAVFDVLRGREPRFPGPRENAFDHLTAP